MEMSLDPEADTRAEEIPNGTAVDTKDSARALSAFDRKTESSSSELYFYYYSQLQHQQNMLQDYVRTGMYYTAITENRADFEGRTVMDVGAGSGILSLFAAQAGARLVLAVEASEMAEYATQLAAANPGFGSRVRVCQCKIEELQGVEQVDVLVSEPMGTLLVNERMLETYVYARDHFLKPGGRMFPQMGRIHAALFSDGLLYSEILSKAAFWLQQQYFGIDITRLHSPAVSSYFSQVVVDAFEPSILASAAVTKSFDFGSVREDELQDIKIPFSLQTERQCDVHGLALWFDVLFQGSTSQKWLSTAPGFPTTHWFQLRCVLRQPITVNAGAFVSGTLRLVAHNKQSYDVYLTLSGPPLHAGLPPQTASGKFNLKEPYYRQSRAWIPQEGQQQPPPPATSAESLDQGAVQGSSVMQGGAVTQTMGWAVPPATGTIPGELV